MKKLSLVFVMVLVAGMAMAQNYAKISSTGNYQKAVIDQSITDLNNNGTIIQSADGSAASDPTIGSIYQVKNNNSASIDQVGFRQYGAIDQISNNTAIMTQKGQWDGSYIYLWGDNNHATVYQDGGSNSANIKTQSNYNGTIANPLSIIQVGNSNGALINTGMTTPSMGNHASISQTANENQSVINQEGGNYNQATINQYSNLNDANLNQTGSSLVANIDQWGGVENKVNLNQKGGMVNIDQNGTSNKVQGLQDAATAEGMLWAEFAGAKLDVMQVGTENALNLKSTTSGAIVDVYQNGMQNIGIVKN